MESPTPQAEIVRFHRMIPAIRPPQRASRDAAGTIPIRAARYCEALTTACGFGWYVFAPLDMQLYWDGTDIHWSCAEFPDWMVLNDAFQYPHFAGTFDRMAPPEAQGCSPPFLTRLPEPGMLQIWTGLIARAAPGWSLNVRPPVNFTPATGYSLFEGILEADLWFGPLFANLRLTHTHQPVRLSAGLPLLQLQPVPRPATADATLNRFATRDGLAAADWADFIRDIAAPNADPNRPPGRYATAVRHRRRCPRDNMAGT